MSDQHGASDAETTTFHDRFGAALARRGVSLSWLQERLAARGSRVSLTTLSYWRSGRRTPERAMSSHVVSDIEELLRLDAHELLRTLPLSRRLGPIAEGLPVEQVASPDVKAALAELDLENWNNGLQELTQQMVVDVDADPRHTLVTMRGVSRATRSGIDRFANVMTFTEALLKPPGVTVVRGSRLGREIFWPDRGVYVAELLLDGPLSQGDHLLGEIALDVVQQEPDDYTGLYCLRRMTEATVWVRFDPTRLPSRSELFVDTAEEETIAPVALTADGSIHHVRYGFGPGKIGVRWRW